MRLQIFQGRVLIYEESSWATIYLVSGFNFTSVGKTLPTLREEVQQTNDFIG